MSSRHRFYGIALLVLTLLLIGGFAAYAIHHYRPKLTVDADYCPLSLAASIIAGIDITDFWPLQEQQRIASSLLAHGERMAKHERFSLHVISGRAEDSAAAWPLPDLPSGFRLCNPVDLNIDPVAQNQRFVRAEYEQKFLTPLKAALAHLVTGATAERSPLLQAIEIMMWAPDFRADVPKRTLILYSDLLHHMPDLSHLRGPITNACTVLASPIGKRLMARNWQGVTVILQYLRNPRDALRQTPGHLRFWVDLFYLLGAEQVFDGATLVTAAASCPGTVATPFLGTPYRRNAYHAHPLSGKAR